MFLASFLPSLHTNYTLAPDSQEQKALADAIDTCILPMMEKLRLAKKADTEVFKALRNQLIIKRPAQPVKAPQAIARAKPAAKPMRAVKAMKAARQPKTAMKSMKAARQRK